MILLITAVVMLQGSGVASGASLVIFTADQIVITVLRNVGADSSLHATTHLLYEGTFYRDTATFWAGIAGIISKVSAVLEGVVTAGGVPLITVIALFRLVCR